MTIKTQTAVAIADVAVENHGSILLFRPLTDEARDWLDEHTDGMRFAGALVVEPRYARDLAEGMLDDGLVVQ